MPRTIYLLCIMCLVNNSVVVNAEEPQLVRAALPEKSFRAPPTTVIALPEFTARLSPWGLPRTLEGSQGASSDVHHRWGILKDFDWMRWSVPEPERGVHYDLPPHIDLSYLGVGSTPGRGFRDMEGALAAIE